MPALLWRSTWRYLLRHRWQSVLSVLGIMLGVMMVVAVDLASNSARRAFDLSVDTVTGNVTHQVIGGAAGVPDAVFPAIRNTLQLRRSAPAITGQVAYRGQALTLLGLDLISEAELGRERPGLTPGGREMTLLAAAGLRESNAVLMTGPLAESLGLAAGDTFRLAPPVSDTPLTLATTIPASNSDKLLFVDIALAQVLLQRGDHVDSIDLVLDSSEAARLDNWLPPGLVLVEAGGRNAALEQMTEAFHVNLLAMGLLALLVAALLIYNTVSLSVLERRGSFGIMRGLGVSRGQLRGLILAENALLGVIGSVLGVVAGWLLGTVLVRLVTSTIDDLFFSLTVTRFMLDPLLLAKGFAWGVGMSMLAAVLPAWQAGRAAPVTLQQKGTAGDDLQRRLPLITGLGGLFLLAGAIVLASGEGLVSGFVALNFLIFGFCLFVPAFLQGLLAALLALGGRRLAMSWRLALRGIQSGLDRTALAVAALTVAVSVTVGVGIMVGSLRDSVLLWLDQTLVGDIQLTRFDSGGVDPGLETLALAQTGIARGSHEYRWQAETGQGPVRIQTHTDEPAAWLFMKDGAPVFDNNTVLVSEPMAWIHGLRIGDRMTLYTDRGQWQVNVGGIFYDYTTGNPLMAVSAGQRAFYWPDIAAQRLTLYLENAANTEAQRQETIATLRSLAQAHPGSYGIASNRDIRLITLEIFDRTFTITHVLRILAIVVAFVGVLSAMLALQLQRLRDYAVLRASGMTVRQSAVLILQQTLVMGVLAGLLAIPLGMLMSEVLIDVINRRSFGWSMQHSLPVSVLLEAVALAAVAALLAGLYPARRVARVHAAAALREE